MMSDIEVQRNFQVLSISSFCVVAMMGWVFIPMSVSNALLHDPVR